MNTPHPTYPLRTEEGEEIKVALNAPGFTHHDIVLIRVKYDMRRDAEFPGWLERYNAEMDQWFKAQRA